MLSIFRTIRNTDLPLGRIVTGAAAIILSASVVAPAVAQQQAAERSTRELSESTGLHHEQLHVYDSIWRDRLEGEAKKTLTAAQATVNANQSKADASAAKTAIAGLDDFTKLDDSDIRAGIDKTQAATAALAAAAANPAARPRSLPAWECLLKSSAGAEAGPSSRSR